MRRPTRRRQTLATDEEIAAALDEFWRKVDFAAETLGAIRALPETPGVDGPGYAIREEEDDDS